MLSAHVSVPVKLVRDKFLKINRTRWFSCMQNIINNWHISMVVIHINPLTCSGWGSSDRSGGSWCPTASSWPPPSCDTRFVDCGWALIRVGSWRWFVSHKVRRLKPNGPRWNRNRLRSAISMIHCCKLQQTVHLFQLSKLVFKVCIQFQTLHICSVLKD